MMMVTVMSVIVEASVMMMVEPAAVMTANVTGSVRHDGDLDPIVSSLIVRC